VPVSTCFAAPREFDDRGVGGEPVGR
jgi:hypothetical protein